MGVTLNSYIILRNGIDVAVSLALVRWPMLDKVFDYFLSNQQGGGRVQCAAAVRRVCVLMAAA